MKATQEDGEADRKEETTPPLLRGGGGERRRKEEKNRGGEKKMNNDHMSHYSGFIGKGEWHFRPFTRIAGCPNKKCWCPKQYPTVK